jgi:cell division protein FtsL
MHDVQLSMTLLDGQGLPKKAKILELKLLLRIGIFFVVALIPAIFYVWSRVQVIHIGYEISQLKSREVELGKQEKHLMLEIEALTSSSRLERIANEVLGMHQPLGNEVVYVKDEDKEQ